MALNIDEELPCSAASRIESPVVLEVENDMLNSLTGRTGSNIIESSLRDI